MWDDLFLLRLWAEADRGEVRSRVAADLRPLAAGPAQSGADWRAEFAAGTARLAAAGLLTADGRQGARLRLTETGRRRVRTIFQLPADGTATAGEKCKRAPGWAWWRDHYAVPLALHGERADTAERLRTVLLRRCFLPELLGQRGGGLEKTVDLLLAKRLGTGQPGPAAFREAVLREWVTQADSIESKAAFSLAPGVPPAPPAERLPDDPRVFAERTLAAARRSATGRFGDAKVFISHVWRGLLAAGKASPEEGELFKERLVRANTAGTLRLSRSDLAGAHEAEDVRASEVEYLGEKFHFVRLD